MRVRTISGQVQSTVTLGAGGYADTITITSTGAVAPNMFGADAIVAPAGLDHARLVNQGTVLGGYGPAGTDGGTGGIGVDLACAAAVINQNVIGGGMGGYGYSNGGNGGAGIVFETGGRLSNSGTIGGGAGHSVYSSYGTGGGGGVGVQLGAGVHAQNSGTIFGGYGAGDFNQEGGPAGAGGAGGVGVLMVAAANLGNQGVIEGGAGGQYAPFGGDGFYYGAGAAGGAGVALRDGGTLSNVGTIAAGAGGGGFYQGGAAGDGVDLIAGGSIGNRGLIVAGTGGDATYANSAAGGIGVDLAAGGTLTNRGTILGGSGGYSVFGHGGAGGAGVFIDGGTVITSGTISGGAGGGGGYGSGAAGDAVQFGSVAGTLVVDPGAVFGGDIAGNKAVADTLVLAGHAPGTLTGLGTTVTGLKNIVVDARAHWLLDGDVSGPGSLLLEMGARLTLDGAAGIDRIVFGAGGEESLRLETTAKVGSVFSGFGSGDVIDLAQVQASSLSYSEGTLSLFGAGGALVETLHFDGKYTQADFMLQAEGQGTDIVYAGTQTIDVNLPLPNWHIALGR